MDHDDPLDRRARARPRARCLRDPIDWEAIEHDFIHGDWSIRRIAEKHGVSSTTVGKRAKTEGWVRLVGTRRLRTGPRPRRPGVPMPKPRSLAARRRAQMLRRLFGVLDARLTEIENRLAQADPAETSAAEVEREMRSVNALARIYAKLVELDDADRESETKKGSETPAATRSDDADQLRRDLALRLERLNQAAEA